MKYIIILFFVSSAFLFNSCEKMLDVESGRSADPTKTKYEMPDDNYYITSALLELAQKLGEREVLLGELRGELMDVSPDASVYMKQLYNFDVTSDNPYANIRDYYAIINNCNYIISNTDTALYYEGEYILKRGYALAKTYRAWAYMQIALNYGKAAWFEKPILKLDDSFEQYPEYNITELANLLIPDLLPLVDIPSTSDRYMYFILPIRFVLGELYLWTGQYENAARQYYNLIVKRNITFIENYRWVFLNGEVVGYNQIYVKAEFNKVTEIPIKAEIDTKNNLIDYANPIDQFGKYWIKPSKTAIGYWDNETYYHDDNTTRIKGDMRGPLLNYMIYLGNGRDGFSPTSMPEYENVIRKYSDRWVLQEGVGFEKLYIITQALVYLRYAEAVNRLGKPNLAFAVLKYGLKGTVISGSIPAKEKGEVLPDYMNFGSTVFDVNIGIHAHGCGNTEKAVDYKIPTDLDSLNTVLYVEDAIVKELALECAFEGHRYTDLMRIAVRRNDPSYLANTVSEKYSNNKEEIKAKLSDPKNWYLPKK